MESINEGVQPQNEAVGEQERFDERDNVFARAALKPDSPQYQA